MSFKIITAPSIVIKIKGHSSPVVTLKEARQTAWHRAAAVSKSNFQDNSSRYEERL